tara:strand:- start:820 stop:1152 length:333 start_codon:yes stop_codon:yes gene_type:complete
MNKMKKAMTTIMTRISTGPLAAVAVHGYAWQWEGFSFVIHRPHFKGSFESSGWTVTETLTGKTVSQVHATRPEAIDFTAARLDKFGPEEFRKLVAANLLSESVHQITYQT